MVSQKRLFFKSGSPTHLRKQYIQGKKALINIDNSKKSTKNYNSTQFNMLQSVSRNVLFFFTNFSQGNILYCPRYLIQNKNLNTASTLTEMKQISCIDFFFGKIFVILVNLFKISLDKYSPFFSLASLWPITF